MKFDNENQALDQDSEEQVENGGQGEVVDAETDGQESAPGAGQVQEEEGGEPGSGGAEDQLPQSRQVNAAARAARVQAEEAMRRQFDAELALLGLANPYTGQPITTFAALRAYGEQYRQDQLSALAQKTGRSVEELSQEQADRDFIRRKREEEARQQAQEQDRARRRAFLEQDLAEFVAKHGDVDVAKLEADPKFRRFAGGRLYQEPLSALYEDYVALMGEAARGAAVRAAGRSARSTGGGQGGGGPTLTPAQQRELAAWNRNNPDMAMTAKEFLEM